MKPVLRFHLNSNQNDYHQGNTHQQVKRYVGDRFGGCWECELGRSTYHRDMWRFMFITALSPTAKKRKPPRCLSSYERIKKMCFIGTRII